MKVICQKAKDGECVWTADCPHSIKHIPEGSECVVTADYCRKCVPVVPEYVRVTRDGEYQSGAFTYYYHSGNVHKVIGEDGSMWRVSDIITDENDPCYIRKAHCEPCEAPEHIPTPYYGSHEHHVALNVEYQRKLKKGETKMKYKRLKPISLELLWAARPGNGCVDFLKEWAVFMNWFVLESGRSWPGQMKFSTSWEAMYDVFMQEMKDHAHASVWLSYMEKHGFIEKESEPITVTLQIEGEDQARELLRGMGYYGLSGFYPLESTRTPLCAQVLEQLQSQGVNL